MTDVPWSTPPELWEKLQPLARQKRYEPTPAEDALWQQLRRNQIGAHFRRQHTIERFIVDFYCAAIKLVVEVDGGIHDYTQEEDAIRGARQVVLAVAAVLEERDDRLPGRHRSRRAPDPSAGATHRSMFVPSPSAL